MPYILVNPPQNLVNPLQIHPRPLHLQDSSKAFALPSHAGGSVLPEASYRAPQESRQQGESCKLPSALSKESHRLHWRSCICKLCLSLQAGAACSPPQHMCLAAWATSLQLHASCSSSLDRPGRFLGQTLCSTAVCTHTTAAPLGCCRTAGCSRPPLEHCCSCAVPQEHSPRQSCCSRAVLSIS